MARIETDPNYSTPTFPRASAATDLFKKEDVQKLAEAMSGHEHGVGKGLPVSRLAPNTIQLASPAIADGAINNAKLQDLTIASTKIADGAITAAKIGTAQVTTNHYVDSSITTPKITGNAVNYAYVSMQLIGPSTSSTSPVIIPGLTFTLTQEPPQTMVWFNTSVYGNTTGMGVYFVIRFDGGAWSTLAYANLKASSHSEVISGCHWISIPSTANHTFDFGWQTGGGTVTINAAAETTVALINMKR